MVNSWPFYPELRKSKLLFSDAYNVDFLYENNVFYLADVSGMLYFCSLNRKSPVGGEQERDFPESSGVAKFCHECGTKYPMLAAKFCCQCGIRRLII